MANKGQIGVTTENIFPVIKQFLYSDHEIFLRELVANAVDATQKLKALALSGDCKEELGELRVRIELDPKKKTLKVIDAGIGMTEEEVDKYINQIAFSSAGEFLEKYKDQIGSIIGHFGLGFYSAFMVSKKVTIDTLSWKEGAKPVLWSCDGSPEYEMKESKRTERGTEITLYLDDDSAEYAEKSRIEGLLGKYCKFMPVPIVFGKEQEWKDGKYVDTDKDHVVNSVEPLWTKAPSELKEEDYKSFYRALYPMNEEPLFYIHLNVDYPFNLTGILYFPKIKDRVAIERNKISLYCNQMFVTDHVDNIVPDFLTLLHGVIDSPDIPLNVSRSYLQSDSNVKKISTYITKKVADRLEEIFDEKFCERALKFALLKNTDGKYFSFDEYKAAVEGEQTDKDKKLVYLYATDVEEQYAFIEAAIRREKRPMRDKDTFAFGAGRVDRRRFGYIGRRNEFVRLSPRELALLEMFVERPSEVLARGMLMSRLWGIDYYGNTRTLDQHINRLRQKLGADGAHIVTVSRVGYAYERDVRHPLHD